MTDASTISEPARVLIVDDDELNADLLSQELEDRGYRVAVASNGKEALDMVVEEPPDLILLDVLMPVMDGIETCRALKRDPQTEHIPIIIMTALTAVEDRVRGIRAGANDYLSKPVDDRELLARIETALRTKRALDRARRELESATNHLETLGRIDRDATVLVASAPAEARPRVVEMMRKHDAHELHGEGRLLRWVFLDDDPSEHALRAAAAAIEISAVEGASVAMEAGSTLVGLTRVAEESDSHWQTKLSGPAAKTAESLVWLAGPHESVVGPEAAGRLETQYDLESLAGSEARRLVGVRGVEEEPTSSLALSWPPEYAGIKRPLRDAWSVSGPIYITRSLSGKSGARVYCVDITTKDFSGQAILKLDAAPHPEWDEEAEARRHRNAVEVNPAYAEQHLPRIVHSLVHDGSAATLASIAGGGLEYVLPWAQVNYDRQLVGATRISRDILREWNRGYTLSEPMGPADLLTAWLGYRLDPEQGRIGQFLQLRGVDLESPSFIFDGNWFPNPYAFAVGKHRTPGRTALRAARGHLHGDLHGFNLLVPSHREEGSYFVIDLAFFEDDAFLFYDNAYFELAHLLHTRESATVRRWMDLLGAAQGAAVPTGDDYGLLRLVEAVRSGATEWIAEREPNRLAYMESQYLLARVAVGLNFVNKRVSEQIKLLSLLYAAMNLKWYLRFQAVDWPAVGPLLRA